LGSTTIRRNPHDRSGFAVVLTVIELVTPLTRTSSDRSHRRDSPNGLTQQLELIGAASETIAQVFAALGSQREGLTAVESAHRLTVYGHNVLPEHRITVVGVMLRQLRNPLLILLAGAAIVSAGTGDPTDAIIIGLILTLSVGLGFTNEYRSEKAALALHSNVHHQTVVSRDGQRSAIDVTDLVPGDVVELSVGSIVPADLRLVEAARFECDEAVLTGESISAAKSATAVPAGTSTADLSSCAFMGTVVHQGTATGVVVATGAATAFGKIAAGLNERPTSTAFQVGLKSFSKLLVAVAAVLTIGIFAINLALSRPLLEALLFSLAIAIGLTPQLLPAIVSVSLAAGSRHLARSHVLVKRLVTIEDLGNIQLLFTDKTGTLTEGTTTFGMVRRVARHSDPCRVPDPNSTRSVLPQSTESSHGRHAHRLGRSWNLPSARPNIARPRLRWAADGVLLHSVRHGRCVPRAD
jgi:P-type Mg2+ transporter